MANEFKVKNGLIVVGDLTTSGTITINGALAATQSWVTSQAYLTSASLSGYATQSYVTSAIAALVDSAPAALDTLNELAAALGDDANFATTITTSIGNKVSKSGDTMTGDLTLNYGYPRINFYDSNHDSDYALINNDGGFSLYDITNNVHRWWVSPSGNMGIGTTSPVAELHVNGSGNTGYLHLTNSTSGSTINDGMTVGVNASNYFVFVREAAPLYFGTDSTERMRITSAGNVGIGTTAPTAKLEVASSGRILGIFRASSTPLTTFYDNTFATGNDSGGANGFIYTSGTGGSFPLDYYGELILQSSPRTGYNNGISLVTGTTSPSVKLRVAENGNVGIGTNSPSSKLQVAGDIRIQNETGLITDYGPLVGRYNTSQVYVGTGGSYSIVKIGRADGGALNVLSGGNVGIGTDSPATKLHVAGNAWINRPSNKVDNASCTELPSRVEFNNAFASGQSGYMIFRYPTYNNFLISGDYDGNIGGAIPNIQFGRQSTVYMHINSSNGNIGIGTTSPGAKLHVGGGEIRVDAGQAVTLDTSNSMYLVGASNQLRLYNGGNPVVNITTGGNVGIGLTSPSVKLDISGSIRSEIGADGNFVTLQATGQRVHYIKRSGQILQFTSDGANTYDVQFDSSNRSVYFATGNVGIGTTSPAGKLSWVDTYYNTFFRTGSPYYGTALIMSGDAGADQKSWRTWARFSGSSGVDMSWEVSTNSVAYGSDPTGLTYSEKMRLTSGGSLGIGTSSPTQRLHIVGVGAINDGITIQNTSASGNSQLRFLNTSGDQRSAITYINSSDATYHWTAGGGNLLNLVGAYVGIGTTTPGARLEVATNSAGTTMLVGRAGGNSSIKALSDNGGYLALDSTGGELILNHYSSANMWLVTGGGNVGIGTSSPIYKLHVSGSAYVNGGTLFLDSSQYLRWGNSNQGIVGVNDSHVAIVSGGSTRQTVYADGRTYFPGLDLSISNVNSTHGTGNYFRGDASHFVLGTSGTLYLNYGGSTTNITGTTYINGNLVWHAGNDGSGSGLDADLFDGQNSTEFLRTLPSGVEASLDSYTDNGVRVIGFTGYSQQLLSWNVGGSTGTVQQLFHYGVPNNGWKIRNKTDNSSWSDWGYVVMASSNQGLISGTIATQSWVGSQSYATTSYVTTQINNLINGAPGALDTLDELAAALGDDANFATTVTNSIAGKMALYNGATGADLNTLLTNGVWRTHGGANGPMETAHTTMISAFQSDGYYGWQLSSNSSDSLFFRFKDANFGSWVQLATRSWVTSQNYVTTSGYNNSNWDTAYSWGNHASAGYALNSALANYLPLSGGSIGGALTINGNLTVNGTITENSSIKLKENVETSEGNLNKVLNLRPVHYNKIGSQTTELGLIAEEVAEVYPEFVQYDENGDPIGVHYSRLTAALIGAVKQLTKRIETLENNG